MFDTDNTRREPIAKLTRLAGQNKKDRLDHVLEVKHKVACFRQTVIGGAPIIVRCAIVPILTMLECLCRLLSGQPSSKVLPPGALDVDNDDDTILTIERDLQVMTDQDNEEVDDDCDTILTATSVSLQEEETDLSEYDDSGRKVRFDLNRTELITPSSIQVFKEATWFTVEELTDMKRSNWQDAQKILRKRAKMLQEQNQESESDDTDNATVQSTLLSRLDALTQTYQQSSKDTKTNIDDNDDDDNVSQLTENTHSSLVDSYTDRDNSFMGLERILVNSLLQKETDALVTRRQICFFMWQHPHEPHKIANFCRQRSQQPVEFAQHLGKAQEAAVRQVHNHEAVRGGFDNTNDDAHCIVQDESTMFNDIDL